MKPSELSAGLANSPLLTRMIANNGMIQSRASALLAGVLVALTGWTLGQVVWLTQESNTQIVAWRPAPQQNAQGKQGERLNLADLQAINLFGVYNENKPKPVVSQPVVQDAPKTRLNLVLVGAVASSNPQTSLAVIANRGQQATYGVGEEIEGTRAKLKAVLVDRVIIDNEGRDETLMLEGVEYKKLSESAPRVISSSTIAKNNPPDTDEQLAQIREEITADPQKIFQYVRLSQVKQEDKVIGYRVSPGKSPQLFEAVGLQDGDIAVQLNGNDLTDPAAMGKIFNAVSELTELNLTVERDGQQHDIYIQF
ncbi:type II secretion system protein GspC [Vibrio vulnificus]|nr:type II secretion system protein GspC [Vibrio vulnificus]